MYSDAEAPIFRWENFFLHLDLLIFTVLTCERGTIECRRQEEESSKLETITLLDGFLPFFFNSNLAQDSRSMAAFDTERIELRRAGVPLPIESRVRY